MSTIFNEDGYNKNGYDENGIDEYGTNRLTGQKDIRITLAEQFISSGLTIEDFCKEYRKPETAVRKAIDSIKTSPCIKDKLTEALSRGEKTISEAVQRQKEKLLAGEISLVEAGCINEILLAANKEEKQRIKRILAEAAAKHNIRILEYQKIFGLDELKENLPTRISERLEVLAKSFRVSKDRSEKELYGKLMNESERVKKYRSQFYPGDLKRIVCLDKDQRECTVEITPELIALAEKYLTKSGEFICFKTMNDFFKQVATRVLNRRQLEAEFKDKKDKEEPEK